MRVMPAEQDLLAGAQWELCAVAATVEHPKLLEDAHLCSIPASVPGTAASALRAAGAATDVDYDSIEWWWRTKVPAVASGDYVLHLDGVATVHDVWVNDDHVHSASAFPFLAAPDAQAVNH